MADNETKLTDLEVRNLEVTGTATIPNSAVALVDVGAVTPASEGLLVRDASNILYISTGTSATSDWTKVGTQV